MTRLFCLFFWVLLMPLVQAVELLGEPQVVLAPTVATLQWKTDVACGTRVSYGLTADKLDQKAEGPVTAVHEVTLKDLQVGKTYHYSLGSARQRLYSGSFTLGASPAATSPATAGTPERPSLLEKVRNIFSPDQKAASKAPAATAQPRAPPTRETWGRIETLRDHFERHGADFQSSSPDDYAAQAWFFLQRGKAGEVPMKWDASDGTLRVFDPKTRAFAAYNRDGSTKTFFRPSNPSYWQRQPGIPIQPSNLPF